MAKVDCNLENFNGYMCYIFEEQESIASSVFFFILTHIGSWEMSVRRVPNLRLHSNENSETCSFY